MSDVRYVNVTNVVFAKISKPALLSCSDIFLLGGFLNLLLHAPFDFVAEKLLYNLGKPSMPMITIS